MAPEEARFAYQPFEPRNRSCSSERMPIEERETPTRPPLSASPGPHRRRNRSARGTRHPRAQNPKMLSRQIWSFSRRVA